MNFFLISLVIILAGSGFLYWRYTKATQLTRDALWEMMEISVVALVSLSVGILLIMNIIHFFRGIS